jgi:hypothetical protein
MDANTLRKVLPVRFAVAKPKGTDIKGERFAMTKTPLQSTRLFFCVLVVIGATLACGSESDSVTTAPRDTEEPVPSGTAEPTTSADVENPVETLTVDSAAAEDVDGLTDALAGDVGDDRSEVLAYLGRPDAFNISIVTVDGVPVKMESWHYYQFGTRVDFVDGAAMWTIEIEPLPEGTILPAWYDPLAFEVGMSEEEATRIVTSASPAGAEPEMIDLSPGGKDLAGGTALVGDQILIGLYQGEVVYVETVALVPEGGEQ